MFSDPNAIRQATTVTMAEGATIDASATDNGDGGTVVLWSDIHNPDSVTEVFGSLTAEGGVSAGDGGQIETSGFHLDALPSSVSASAANGERGEWLLDPYNIVISSSTSGTSFSSSGVDYTYTPSVNSTILASSIDTALNAGTNVTVSTGLGGSNGSSVGDITVNSAINATTANGGDLTLEAARNIVLNASLTTVGSMTFAGDVEIAAVSVSLSTMGGGSTGSDITFTGNIDGSTANSQSLFMLSGAGAISVAGSVGGITALRSLGLGGTGQFIPSMVTNFDYTGGIQTYSVDRSATHTLKVWGAQGGGGAINFGVGGGGGLAIGEYSLSAGETVYVYVGQQGFRSASSTAFNGGGSGSPEPDSVHKAGDGFTGGGATHMALASDPLASLSSNLDRVLIVAGGGGGAGGGSTPGGLSFPTNGGGGGGPSGSVGETEEKTGFTHFGGGGGTQDSGGVSVEPHIAASFGVGASADRKPGTFAQGGGGGGGWYGGGAGTGSGGGGGSSYIGAVNNGTTLSNARSGHGTATIERAALTVFNASSQTGSVSIGGTVNVGSLDTAATNFDIALAQTSGNVTLVSDVTFNNTGTLQLGGGASGQSVSVTGKLDASAAALTKIGAGITTDNAQTYAAADLLGNVTLSTTNSAVNFSGAIDSVAQGAHDLTINAGSGAINLSGAVGVDVNGSLGDVTLNSTGATTLGGAVTAARVTTNSGGTLAIDGGSVTTTGNQSYGETLTLGADTTFYTADLTAAAINLSTYDLTADVSGTGSVTGSISGSGDITKAGDGTLTLSGSSSYSGATLVNAGTLAVGHANALGSAAGNTEVAAGATLDLVNVAIASEALVLSGGTLKDSTSSWGGTIVLSADSTFDIQTGDTLTVSGVISGAGRLTKVGDGTVVLSNASNTYAGGTALEAGVLSISADGNLGTTPSLADADNLTIAGGTLKATAGFTLNSNRGVSLGAGGASAGTIEVDSPHTFVIDGVVADATGDVSALELIKIGSGTLVLSGDNTYSGGTTISTGTLQVGNGSSSGSLGTGAIINNAALVFDRAGELTVSALISGTGGLTQAGTGTLTLTGENTFGGSVLIGNGTLVAAVNSALGNGASAIDVSAGATLGLEGGITLSRNTDLNDGSGVGTIRNFSGDNTLSGTIELATGDNEIVADAGTLIFTGAINSSGSPADSSLTLSGAGGITFDRALEVKDFTSTAANLTLAGDLTARGDAGGTSIGVLSIAGNLTTTGAITIHNQGTSYFSTSSKLEMSGTVTAGGDLTLRAWQFDVSSDIDASTKVLTVQPINTGSNNSPISLVGEIKAAELAIVSGQFADISIANAANQISAFAVDQAGDLTLSSASALTIDSINPTGITASGDILIETLSGDLIVAKNIVSNSSSGVSVTLVAGKNTAAGTRSGGDIKITNGATITLNHANSQGLLYTGSLVGSVGIAESALAAADGLVGYGSGRFRYNADSTTDFNTADWAALSGSGFSAIYREQPSVTGTVSSASMNYGETILPTFTFSDSNGTYYGDTINDGAVAFTVVGLTASQNRSGANLLKVNANGYEVTASGLSTLGYDISAITSGTLTVVPKNISVTGITIQNKTYDGSVLGATATAGTLVGIETNDAVNLSTVVRFNNKDVESTKTVDLDYNLLGDDGANYTLADEFGVATSALIEAKTVALSATKEYDGMLDLSGSVRIDTGVTVAGTAETLSYSAATALSKDVADNSTNYITAITLANATDGSAGLAINYRLPTLDSANAAVTITPRVVTLTAPRVSKVYDGNSSYSLSASDLAAITASAALANNETITAATINYSNRHAGADDKAITLDAVTVSSANSNYSFTLLGNNNSSIQQLASATWIGSSDGNWADANNWAWSTDVTKTGALPDADNVALALIPASFNATVTVTAGHDYAGRIELAGGVLAISDDSHLGAVPTAVVDDAIRFNGGTLAASGPRFEINSKRGMLLADGSDGTLSVTSGSVLDYAGIISGGGNLFKAGSGELVFAGQNNSYSGTTHVQAGKLFAGAATRAATVFGSGVVTIEPGARIRLDRAALQNDWILNGGLIEATNGFGEILHGDITINGNPVFDVMDKLTLLGDISGSGRLLLNNNRRFAPGELRIGGEVDTTVAIELVEGILQIGTGATVGNISGNIDVSGRSQLWFNRSDSYTYSGVISGAGEVYQVGSGEVRLVANQTYRGATTISNGTLVFSHDAPTTASSSFAGAGELRIEPRSDDFSANFSTTGWNFAASLGGLSIGKNSSADGSMDTDITVAEAISIAGPIAIYGANVRLDDALTSTSSTITLAASSGASQAAGAPMTTSALVLQGAGDFILSNANNAVQAVAGGTEQVKLGKLQLVNSGALVVETINPVGLIAADEVMLVTRSGDLTVNAPISTDSNTATALTLIAGSTATAGTAAGGNVHVAATLNTAAGGRMQVFTGSIADSRGLTEMIGHGSGNFRYNADPSSDFSIGSWAPINSHGAYAFYREQPTLAGVINDVNMVYGDAMPAFSISGSGGLVNGDSEVVFSIRNADYSQANHLSVGSYVLNAPGLVGLGYNLGTISSGTLTVAAKPLTVVVNNDAKFVTADDVAGYAGITYVGFVAGENASTADGFVAPVISRVGTDASAGVYSGALVASGAAASNYAISYSAGNYSIVPSNQLIVRVNNASSVYAESTAYRLASVEYLNAGTVVRLDDQSVAGASVAINASNRVSINDGSAATASFTLSPANAVYSAANRLAVGSYQLIATAVTTSNAENFSDSITVVGTHAVTPRSLSVSVAGIDKIYDGNSRADIATGDNRVANDQLTIAVTAAFADKNVGTDKTITIADIRLIGSDAANYQLDGLTASTTTATITRRDRVTWIGGDNGDWFDPDNWEDGAVPDRTNVANVLIAEGVVVNFDPNAAVSPAQSNEPVELDSLGSGGGLTQTDGTLVIGTGGMTLDSYTLNGGKLSNTGTTTLESFSQNGGAFSSDGAFTTERFVQTNGTATIGDDFTVLADFSQGSNGGVTVMGDVAITDTDGGVVLGNLTSGGSTSISSTDGAITQAQGTQLELIGAVDILASNGQTPASYFDIVLDGEANSLAGMVKASGENVALAATGDLDAAITAAGDTSLNGSGALSVQLAVTGNSTLDATGNVTIAGSSNNLAIISGGSTNFGETAVAGDFTLNSAGKITSDGELIIAGDQTVSSNGMPFSFYQIPTIEYLDAEEWLHLVSDVSIKLFEPFHDEVMLGEKLIINNSSDFGTIASEITDSAELIMPD